MSFYLSDQQVGFQCRSLELELRRHILYNFKTEAKSVKQNHNNQNLANHLKDMLAQYACSGVFGPKSHKWVLNGLTNCPF